MLLARNLVFTHVTNTVAVLVHAKNGIAAHVTPTILIHVCTHIVETSITDTAFVAVIAFDLTHIGHPYLTVIADVVAYPIVISVIFTRYRTNGRHLTYVAHAVCVVIEAKIGKAAEADITDVITIIIYVSVVIGIGGLSAVVTMSVFITVYAFKSLKSSVTLVTPLGAYMQTSPHDVVVNVLFRHKIIVGIVFIKNISLKNFHLGRSNGLTVLKL